jgi:hypothetical protein
VESHKGECKQIKSNTTDYEKADVARGRATDEMGGKEGKEGEM